MNILYVYMKQSVKFIETISNSKFLYKVIIICNQMIIISNEDETLCCKTFKISKIMGF